MNCSCNKKNVFIFLDFTDELHLYPVFSSKAHAKILSVDPSAALQSAGAVDYVSAPDVRGVNNLGIFMDTVFAVDKVDLFVLVFCLWYY